MKDLVIPLEDSGGANAAFCGNKAAALSAVMGLGLPVPGGVCVTRRAYDEFVRGTGIDRRITVELGRKEFGEMRWEEMWDASLRIRNMFATAEPPAALADAVLGALSGRFAGKAVAVRSSSLAEDSEGASFAGLHESYVNVTGAEEILRKVVLVWASLWSDAALLYRDEMALDTKSSSMAVVIQEMVFGEASGVGFCVDPNDPSQAVIESVRGLNKGLVDGDVEPDRFFVDRSTGKVVSSVASASKRAARPVPGGVAIEEAGPDAGPSMGPAAAERVYSAMARLEKAFGSPQDVEWTLFEGEVFILQSRPITAGAEDERSWYLSLRRSLDNLVALSARLEDEVLPSMDREAARLSAVDPANLADEALARSLEERREAFERWKAVYWDECIPFAHGVRLFGTVYNDVIGPDDPFEFIGLVAAGGLKSLDRNSRLEETARYLREHPESVDAEGRVVDERLKADIGRIVEDMGTVMPASGASAEESVLRVIREMGEGASGGPRAAARDAASMEKAYLAAFAGGEERERAATLLEIARKSYRLRDDDNIYLGRVEASLISAVAEAKRRISKRQGSPAGSDDPAELARALVDKDYVPRVKGGTAKERSGGRVSARQLRGQPAGKGVARGKARVIQSGGDLFSVKKGEILVVDSIDPSMTFVIPLVEGIVERRGGMLIHGAIIAREYGIACVTGVPGATESIRTGDSITVDGYAGLVINHTRTHPAPIESRQRA